jgi:hypothetical protein
MQRYLDSFGIVWILKQYLEDEQCSCHANSISGHYFMHLYYILTVVYFMMNVSQTERHDWR